MAPPIGLGLGIPNNRVGRGAGGGGGGGGDLPTGGVFLDLDADVGVTLGPSSRTTEWLDNSPAANHLAEVDGAGFVLVPNSINGNSVLRADTTFKTLRRNLLTNGTISQPGTVYSVARWPTSGADGHMFSSTTNNSNRWIQGHIGNADHRPGMYAGTVVSSGTSVSGRVVVMRTYFDGASSESLVWAHGLSPFTFSGNVGAGTLSSVLIGGSQWSFLGDFARFFCLTRLTTAQEDVATMTIFANRYGVVTV